jgi:hypothetical protein
MIIRKRRDKIVAMIILGLHPEFNPLIHTRLLGRLHKVLGKQLALFIEIVSGALFSFQENYR